MPPPPANDSPLSARAWRYIIFFTSIGLLWKSFTQRAPFFLLPAIPAIPSPHTCKVHHADKLHNCEDFTQLPGTSKILLGCDPSRRQWSHLLNVHPPNMAPGELWIADYSTPTAEPIRLPIPQIPDFRPLGIDAIPSGEGWRVFIANHAYSGNRIEILDLTADLTLSNHTTLTSPLIRSPNGIAAISPTSFYVTNDLFSPGVAPFLNTIEMISGLAGGSLIHVPVFAPENAKQLVRLPFANGVAIDKAGSKLYVASSTTGIYEYHFSPSDPTRLSQPNFLRTAAMPDNLVFTEQGLFIANAVSAFGLRRSLQDEKAPKPPGVAFTLLPRADVKEKSVRGADIANGVLRRDEWRWKTVFMDDGAFYGGVSTVGVFGDGVLVGSSLLASGVLVCDEVPVKGRSMPVEEEAKDEL